VVIIHRQAELTAAAHTPPVNIITTTTIVLDYHFTGHCQFFWSFSELNLV